MENQSSNGEYIFGTNKYYDGKIKLKLLSIANVTVSKPISKQLLLLVIVQIYHMYE